MKSNHLVFKLLQQGELGMRKSMASMDKEVRIYGKQADCWPPTLGFVVAIAVISSLMWEICNGREPSDNSQLGVRAETWRERSMERLRTQDFLIWSRFTSSHNWSEGTRGSLKPQDGKNHGGDTLLEKLQHWKRSDVSRDVNNNGINIVGWGLIGDVHDSGMPNKLLRKAFQF